MYVLRRNLEFKPIFSISNFLNESEIEKIFDIVKTIDSHDSFLSKDSLINTNIRSSTLKWITLKEDTNWLFEKIIDCINEVNVKNFNYVIKYLEDLQFTEYSNEKNFYSPHVDCGDVHSIDKFVDVRKISFSVQLSDPEEYRGGDLKFFLDGLNSVADRVKIGSKEKGTIIFFPSNIFHEVTPVTEGKRYSLVSWINGPNLM